MLFLEFPNLNGMGWLRPLGVGGEVLPQNSRGKRPAAGQSVALLRGQKLWQKFISLFFQDLKYAAPEGTTFQSHVWGGGVSSYISYTTLSLPFIFGMSENDLGAARRSRDNIKQYFSLSRHKHSTPQSFIPQESLPSLFAVTAGAALPQISDLTTPGPPAAARPGKFSPPRGQPEDHDATEVGQHHVEMLLNGGVDAHAQKPFVISTRAGDRVRMSSMSY